MTDYSHHIVVSGVLLQKQDTFKYVLLLSPPGAHRRALGDIYSINSIPSLITHPKENKKSHQMLTRLLMMIKKLPAQRGGKYSVESAGDSYSITSSQSLGPKSQT